MQVQVPTPSRPPWAILAAAALAALAACGGASARPRGVILISLDTLRGDRLGCYGYHRPTSPFLDELAAKGTLFERVVAQAPWTLPSHATMLTGRLPHAHGVVDHARRLPESVPTLASLLAERGYATAAMVNSKWINVEQGLLRGFAEHERFREGGPNRGPEITRAAVSWLERHSDEPYFLFLHYYDVHSPYSAPPATQELFTAPYEGPVDGTTAQLVEIRNGTLRVDPTDLRHLSDLYDAEVRALDDELRALWEGLARLGIADDTLVVVTSDHGEELGEHGGVLHGRTLHGEVLNVPLIVAGPGVVRGARVSELALVADVVPTILARLGFEPPPGIDGTDLLDPHGGASPRVAFAAADWQNAEPDSLRMVQTPRYKLCHDRLASSDSLYDLERDPGEQVDVSPLHPNVVEALLAEISRILAGATEAAAIEGRSAEEIEFLRSLGYF